MKSNDHHGLFAFKSGDAINWTPMSNKPVITNGAFDSQNIGFFKFDDEKLYINFSTSIAGSIRMEVLDHRGIPIPGFTLKDCEVLFGDALDREVRWSGNAKPGDLLNKNIRLKIYLEDADLYSFIFK